MEINDVRLANIERLAAPYRYAKDFCAAAGIDPSYLSQLRSGAKTLGSDLARRIEERLGLERGTLDERTDSMRTASHAASAVAHAIESLDPPIKAAIAALVFELAKRQLAPSTPVSTFDVTVADSNAPPQQQQPQQQGHPVPRRSGKR